MRLATSQQSRKIDRHSQEIYNLSAEILMESAGALAACEIAQSFFPEISQGLTTVICGPGHNGGDGWVLARHLYSMGHKNLRVLRLDSRRGSRNGTKTQRERVQKLGIQILTFGKHGKNNESHGENFRELLKPSTLLVDAIFGIGCSRKVEGEVKDLIDLINSLETAVVSLDVPSGLNCDRGIIEGTAVRATMTISFGLAKPGFFVADGPSCVGRLRVLPIGFPPEVLEAVATTHSVFDEKLARHHLPRRKDRSHKSDHGRLLVCAGSEGYWGAGVLAASSAYRMGVGYVVWASDTLQHPLIDIPEVLTARMDEALSGKSDAIVLGCGLGVNEKTAHWIEKVKEGGCKKVVIDADGITTSVKFNLMPFPESWVITPHAGELSRVIGQEVCDIERDRFGAALRAARQVGCHVLLKGYRSVLAHGDRCTVINSGNSALAKAGTGDVLAGMIGSLLAQGLETLPATAMAAYLHGRMADEWVRTGAHKASLNPSDLKDSLPSLLGYLEGS